VLYTATVYVPAETADGTYVTYFVLFANEFPMDPPVLVRVNIIVDSTNPGVSILAPSANAHVAGTTTLQAAVADGNNVASVTFTAGAASGAMARDPVTGLWTASWATTGTADGVRSIAVIATDVAGNNATATRSVVVDNTAPTASFSSPAAGSSVRGQITVAFAATDVNLASATLAYGGTTVSVTGTTSASVDTRTLGDGARTLTLTAVDKAGNSRTATLSLTIDNTAPSAALTFPEAGAHLRGTVNARFAASDVNFDRGNITIGTRSFDIAAGQTTRAVDTTALADGTYTMTLTVVDRAGNVGSASVSVTVDNTVPTVSISAPTANANLRGSATITWSAADANLDQVWLTIDGETQDVTGTTSFAWNTNTIGDGSHTIEIRVVDRAGNEATAVVAVTTDNTAVATAAAQTTGLTYGIIIAVILAVVGFVVGWLLGRRKKPEGQGTPPQPSESRGEEL